ncbi:winged helix-turn-helix transcriptional regulator [Candidatus Peregrinibacteria bacterium]|nr:winged helix-turn-helix transcriptional regulator [Candidatus Peregrinibacteria bacterium]
MALFSKLTADSNRNNIIYLLYKFHAFCVCDLANILDISVASASQHLRKLHDKGLVTTRKEKQTIYYVLSDKNFISYLKCLYGKI